jgi:hypothetical protein
VLVAGEDGILSAVVSMAIRSAGLVAAALWGADRLRGGDPVAGEYHLSLAFCMR